MSVPESATTNSTEKRVYRRRSDDERIADLERQIHVERERLKKKEAAERAKRELNPAVKKIPQLAKHLQNFSQLAVDHGRLDLSNMVTMFLVGLQRIHGEETEQAHGPAELTEEELAQVQAEQEF